MSLDQAVIRNPAHDLIRLALSLATAAQGSDLPGASTVHILQDMIAGYRGHWMHLTKRQKRGEATKPVQMVLRQELKRKWRRLATERIEDVKPKIPLSERFLPLTKAEKDEIKRVLKPRKSGRLSQG